MTRLLNCVQKLDVALYGVPVQLFVSGGAMQDNEMQNNHGNDDWAGDWQT